MNDLDVEGLVGSVLRGVLGGRRKRSRGALRFLTGGGRHSSFLNASTLMTLAGVAWGVYETAKRSSGEPPPPTVASGPVPSPPAQASGRAVPPPLPASTAGGVVPPPLPASVAGPAVPPPLPGPAPAMSSVPPQVLQVLRLTLAAARADGTLAPNERDAILARAREVGAEAAIAAELDAPRPLADVVAAATDPKQKQDMYTLAFAIVRADETVTDAERAWLTGLAGHLGLDAAIVDGLEQQAAARITAAAEGAQH